MNNDQLEKRFDKFEAKLAELAITSERILVMLERDKTEHNELKASLEKLDKDGSQALHAYVNKAHGAAWLIGILVAVKSWVLPKLLG